MKQLRAARALALPDWCIAAAGFSCAIGCGTICTASSPPREPPDIDVLYYDAADLSKERGGPSTRAFRRPVARSAVAGAQPGAHACLEGPATAPRHGQLDDLLAGNGDGGRRAARRPTTRLTVIAPLGTDDLLEPALASQRPSAARGATSSLGVLVLPGAGKHPNDRKVLQQRQVHRQLRHLAAGETNRQPADRPSSSSGQGPRTCGRRHCRSTRRCPCHQSTP